MPLNSETITAIALGIALSASCGFRVFIPVLAASVAGHFNLLSLPQNMQWMSGWPALICFATAAVLELAAYYIPFVDNLLDAIATPLAVCAGTMLAYAVFPQGDNAMLTKWVLGFITGGAAAGTIQAGTGLLRLVSSKTTAGAGNAIVATGENAAAITGSISAFLIPLITASLLLLLILWILVKAFKKMFAKSRFKSGNHFTPNA